ncbi:disease resistance protein L6-like [Syzygium oleosum]|uniref:disease resistance protein L6-like n=1 Tax=Syzygium oleosum TaxID=219896 RepID=UPI0024BADB1C|nr:disease resistance protein L6-like [Syzygium oleosum]
MWECRESNGQIVIPIFYDVSPSDVIHQAGDFGRRFDLHETAKVDSDTIKKWRDVLRQIGRLRGFIRENVNGHDSQLVKIVVKSVEQVLRKDDQVVTDRLVGIDHHVQEMMKKLGVAYREGQAVEVQGEEVRVVIIEGAPGVGKTTLAKVVFNKMRKLFDAYSFLEDIRSEGVQFSRHMLIADLQKQKPEPLESSGEEIANLCRNVRVLIVLDGVDEDEQIKELVGKFTSFGPGSRIIVTTDKRNVSEAFDVGAFDRRTVELHKVGPMSEKNALDLFHKHAFQGAAAEDVSEYDSLSRDIVKAIGGLPSEIVHHASNLRRNMNMDTWKTTLDLLRKKPKK